MSTRTIRDWGGSYHGNGINRGNIGAVAGDVDRSDSDCGDFCGSGAAIGLAHQ
jgi:hypothetical protein